MNSEETGGTIGFASPIVDLGIFVSDLDKSVAFYTQAIGFKEVVGFSVPPDIAGDSGLTDSKGLDISVLKLDLDETHPSTDLKLMQIPDVKTTELGKRFIHSHYGYAYISLFVTDMASHLVRLKEAGVKPLAKSPVTLPLEMGIGIILRPQVKWDPEDATSFPEPPENVFLTVVKDPDGNFIELVGP